eukprot:9000994-Pyramimonas_sp.AAC.1
MLIIVVPPHPKRSFESTLYIHLLDAYNESIDPRKYARRKYAYRKYQVCFWFRFSQPHLKKCFEGIKKLEMHKPGTDGRRHYEATGMFSPDGEYIPFAGTCVTDGRPEDWLNKVYTPSPRLIGPPCTGSTRSRSSRASASSARGRWCGPASASGVWRTQTRRRALCGSSRRSGSRTSTSSPASPAPASTRSCAKRQESN